MKYKIIALLFIAYCLFPGFAIGKSNDKPALSDDLEQLANKCRQVTELYDTITAKQDTLESLNNRIQELKQDWWQTCMDAIDKGCNIDELIDQTDPVYEKELYDQLLEIKNNPNVTSLEPSTGRSASNKQDKKTKDKKKPAEKQKKAEPKKPSAPIADDQKENEPKEPEQPEADGQKGPQEQGPDTPGTDDQEKEETKGSDKPAAGSKNVADPKRDNPGTSKDKKTSKTPASGVQPEKGSDYDLNNKSIKKANKN